MRATGCAKGWFGDEWDDVGEGCLKGRLRFPTGWYCRGGGPDSVKGEEMAWIVDE